MLIFIIYRINTYKHLNCQVISQSIYICRSKKFNRFHVKSVIYVFMKKIIKKTTLQINYNSDDYKLY